MIGTELQDQIVEEIFKPYAVTLLYYSYGFVFFYFGLQKPAPGVSPPQVPIAAAMDKIALLSTLVSLDQVVLFIGLYEMALGVLFFLKKIRVAFWLFLLHQAVGFSLLFIIPYQVFQPPWITVFGVSIPWILDSFSAFVLKNVIFVAGFMLLCVVEWQEKS